MKLREIIIKFDEEIKNYHVSTDSFNAFVSKILDAYLIDLQSSPNLFEDLFDNVLLTEKDFFERTKTLINGVKESLNHYLFISSIDGKAYEILKTALEKSKLLSQLTSNSYRIKPRTGVFFRIRSTQKDENLSQKELFHIPYDKRGLASTQRYSLPGFTHLYLANSLYTAWKELREPDHISVIRFTNNFPMVFIDLDSASFVTRKFANPEDEPQALVDYATLFPLLVACTLKVRNDNHNFKTEYIMPQLFLQCIRELAPDIMGIRYRSTRIESLDTAKDNFINYVIPPRKIDDKGYCESLLKAFSMTAVEKVDLTEIYEAKEHEEHAEIKTLKIKGIPLLFKNSKFAQVETRLAYLKLERHDFNKIV